MSLQALEHQLCRARSHELEQTLFKARAIAVDLLKATPEGSPFYAQVDTIKVSIRDTLELIQTMNWKDPEA